MATVTVPYRSTTLAVRVPPAAGIDPHDAAEAVLASVGDDLLTGVVVEEHHGQAAAALTLGPMPAERAEQISQALAKAGHEHVRKAATLGERERAALAAEAISRATVLAESYADTSAAAIYDGEADIVVGLIDHVEVLAVTTMPGDTGVTATVKIAFRTRLNE